MGFYLGDEIIMRRIEFKISNKPHVKLKMALFKPFFKLLLGDSMAVKRTALMLRLRPEDREVIRQLAKYYDIAEADVVKILIREYLKNHNIVVGSSSS